MFFTQCGYRPTHCIASQGDAFRSVPMYLLACYTKHLARHVVNGWDFTLWCLGLSCATVIKKAMVELGVGVAGGEQICFGLITALSALKISS